MQDFGYENIFLRLRIVGFELEVADMDDGDVRERIARLETDLERLGGTLVGCRKAMLLAKVAIAAGALWISATSIGAIRFDSTAAIVAIVAVVGGIVIYGSNSSTSKQITEAMKAAETQRSELIDKIDPRTVSADRR